MTTPDMYERIIEQAPDAMVFSDARGVVQLWNVAAERMFGFAAAEVIGQPLDFMIPERFREAHWRGFERAVAARLTKYVGQALPTRALHADGHQFYVELSFAVILGEGGYASGDVAGVLSCARDINERFEQDRVTRKRLQELEAAAGSRS